MSIFTFHVTHFDLDKIAESGQCFRWEKLYRRKYRIPAGCACAYVIQEGDTLTVEDLGGEPGAEEFWANYFVVHDDYDGMWREIDRYAAEDGPEAYLSRAARAADGVVLLNQPVWETIVSFIVSQNNNIPRIRRSIEKVCDKYGTMHLTAVDWWRDFPSPAVLSRADLSDIGLGYRAEYIQNLAAAVVSGRFDLNFLQTVDYDTARAYLKSVRGVGDKVANCICLFALGHKAAFPVDTWIRRAVEREFGGEFPVARYPGYAGLVQQFMFYYEKNGGKAE